jgi:hypothetical protein
LCLALIHALHVLTIEVSRIAQSRDTNDKQEWKTIDEQGIFISVSIKGRFTLYLDLFRASDLFHINQ